MDEYVEFFDHEPRCQLELFYAGKLSDAEFVDLIWYDQLDNAYHAEIVYLEPAYEIDDDGIMFSKEIEVFRTEYDLKVLMCIELMNRERGIGTFGLKEIAEEMPNDKSFKELKAFTNANKDKFAHIPGYDISLDFELKPTDYKTVQRSVKRLERYRALARRRIRRKTHFFILLS